MHALFCFEAELQFEVMAGLLQQGLMAHGVQQFAAVKPG